MKFKDNIVNSGPHESMEGLFESITYTYKAPADREKRIYDFYVFELYKSLLDHPATLKKGLLKPGWDEDTVHDLIAIVNDGNDEIIKVLKADILDAVSLSIASELRHAFSSTSYHERVLKAAGSHKDKIEKFYINYLKQSSIANAPDWVKKKRGIENDGTSSSYTAAKRAFDRSGMSYQDLGEAAAPIFMISGIWDSQYGGKNWANIANALVRLATAKSPQDNAIAIDHILDLEHNTGTVFNKVKRFAGQDQYQWIKKALDFKFSASPWKLAQRSSVPSSVIGRLNRLTGADKNLDQTDLEKSGKTDKASSKSSKKDRGHSGFVNIKNMIDNYIGTYAIFHFEEQSVNPKRVTTYLVGYGGSITDIRSVEDFYENMGGKGNGNYNDVLQAFYELKLLPISISPGTGEIDLYKHSVMSNHQLRSIAIIVSKIKNPKRGFKLFIGSKLILVTKNNIDDIIDEIASSNLSVLPAKYKKSTGTDKNFGPAGLYDDVREDFLKFMDVASKPLKMIAENIKSNDLRELIIAPNGDWVNMSEEDNVIEKYKSIKEVAQFKFQSIITKMLFVTLYMIDPLYVSLRTLSYNTITKNQVSAIAIAIDKHKNIIGKNENKTLVMYVEGSNRPFEINGNNYKELRGSISAQFMNSSNKKIALGAKPDDSDASENKSDSSDLKREAVSFGGILSSSNPWGNIVIGPTATMTEANIGLIGKPETHKLTNAVDKMWSAILKEIGVKSQMDGADWRKARPMEYYEHAYSVAVGLSKQDQGTKVLDTPFLPNGVHIACLVEFGHYGSDSDNNPYAGARIVTHEEGKDNYYIFVLRIDSRSSWKSLSSTKFIPSRKKAALHESIHAIDNMHGSKLYNAKNVLRTPTSPEDEKRLQSDLEDYYSDPAEARAYTAEFLDELSGLIKKYPGVPVNKLLKGSKAYLTMDILLFQKGKGAKIKKMMLSKAGELYTRHVEKLRKKNSKAEALTESTVEGDIDVGKINTGSPVSGYLYHGSSKKNLEVLSPAKTSYEGDLGWGLYLAEEDEAAYYGNNVYRVPVKLRDPFILETFELDDFPYARYKTTKLEVYQKWAWDEEYQRPGGFYYWYEYMRKNKKIHPSLTKQLTDEEKVFIRKVYEDNIDVDDIEDDKEEELADSIQDKWDDIDEPIFPESILVGESVTPFVFVLKNDVVGVFDGDGLSGISDLVEKAGHDALVVSGIRNFAPSPLNHEVVVFEEHKPDQVNGEPIVVDESIIAEMAQAKWSTKFDAGWRMYAKIDKDKGYFDIDKYIVGKLKGDKEESVFRIDQENQRPTSLNLQNATSVKIFEKSLKDRGYRDITDADKLRSGKSTYATGDEESGKIKPFKGIVYHGTTDIQFFSNIYNSDNLGYGSHLKSLNLGDAFSVTPKFESALEFADGSMIIEFKADLNVYYASRDEDDLDEIDIPKPKSGDAVNAVAIPFGRYSEYEFAIVLWDNNLMAKAVHLQVPGKGWVRYTGVENADTYGEFDAFIGKWLNDIFGGETDDFIIDHSGSKDNFEWEDGIMAFKDLAVHVVEKKPWIEMDDGRKFYSSKEAWDSVNKDEEKSND